MTSIINTEEDIYHEQITQLWTTFKTLQTEEQRDLFIKFCKKAADITKDDKTRSAMEKLFDRQKP